MDAPLLLVSGGAALAAGDARIQRTTGNFLRAVVRDQRSTSLTDEPTVFTLGESGAGGQPWQHQRRLAIEKASPKLHLGSGTTWNLRSDAGRFQFVPPSGPILLDTDTVLAFASSPIAADFPMQWRVFTGALPATGSSHVVACGLNDKLISATVAVANDSGSFDQYDYADPGASGFWLVGVRATTGDQLRIEFDPAYNSRAFLALSFFEA